MLVVVAACIKLIRSSSSCDTNTPQKQDPGGEAVRGKHASKHKHVEGDIHQLQRQMQGLQKTLNDQMQAQQCPGRLGDPKLKRPLRKPDELSVADSGDFERGICSIRSIGHL